MASPPPLEGVYVIAGEEPAGRRQALAKLRARSGDWEHVSLATAGPEALMAPTLLSSPDRPVVRVAEDYPKWKPAQRKALAKIAAQPSPGVAAVILVKSLGAKDPLAQALPAARVISLKAPAAGGHAAWLESLAARDGVTLEPGAAAEIVSRAGESTSLLACELDKLAACAGGGPVTVDLARGLVAVTPAAQAGWGWTDMIIAGRRQEAFRLMGGLEAQGESPLALTAVLAGRLALIAWVHLGVSAEQAGAKPYPWKLAVQAAKGGWGPGRVAEAIAATGACERAIKGASHLPPWAEAGRLAVTLTS